MGKTKNPTARKRYLQRQQQRAMPQILVLYEELHQRFPHTFFREPEKVSPLKKGTYQELKAVMTDSPYNGRVISWALNRYTRRYGYVQAVAEGKPRIDLAGNAVGIVTEEEQQQAIAQLKTMRRRRWKPRQTDKTKDQVEGTSLGSDTSGETVTEAQGGKVTEDQEEPQPTTARQKTTKKRSGTSRKVEKTEEQAGGKTDTGHLT